MADFGGFAVELRFTGWCMGRRLALVDEEVACIAAELAWINNV